MYKKLFATLLIACLCLFSVSFASSATIFEISTIASPLAVNSLEQTGDINVSVDVKTISKSTENGTEVIAYGRSTGCSSGCSSGCSMGCSSGCSSGCSMGCSRGCGGW